MKFPVCSAHPANKTNKGITLWILQVYNVKNYPQFFLNIISHMNGTDVLYHTSYDTYVVLVAYPFKFRLFKSVVPNRWSTRAKIWSVEHGPLLILLGI